MNFMMLPNRACFLEDGNVFMKVNSTYKSQSGVNIEILADPNQLVKPLKSAMFVADNCTTWVNDLGELHRVDGPARIFKNGDQVWWLNDQLHRVGGPAITLVNGLQEWLEHGKWHRLDGPAKIWPDDTTMWYKHGHLHRIEGPAIEHADGRSEWWVNGLFIDNPYEQMFLGNITDTI